MKSKALGASDRVVRQNVRERKFVVMERGTVKSHRNYSSQNFHRKKAHSAQAPPMHDYARGWKLLIIQDAADALKDKLHSKMLIPGLGFSHPRILDHDTSQYSPLASLRLPSGPEALELLQDSHCNTFTDIGMRSCVHDTTDGRRCMYNLSS